MKTKEIIISFVKKFKLESIAIVVTSLIATVVFDMEKIEKNKFLEAFIILSFVATGSFLVDKIFVIYEDFIKQKIAIKKKKI